MSFLRTPSMTLSWTQFTVFLIEYHTYWKCCGWMTVDSSRVDHTVLYFWPFYKIRGCSSQLPNVPQWSLLPCIHALGFHPTCSRADLCKRMLLSETETQDQIIKPIATSILHFWIPCPGRKLAAISWRHSRLGSALWRHTWWTKETLQVYVSKPSRRWALQPQSSFQMTANSGHCIDSTSWKMDWSHTTKPPPKSWPA